MAKVKYTNRTVYTKEFQKKVALANVLQKDKAFVPVLMMMLALFTGSASLNSNPRSVGAWVMMLLGFVVIPVTFFVIPFFFSLKSYKDMEKDGIFVVEAEFTNSLIRFKNSLNQVFNLLYEDIKEIRLNKDILMIASDKASQTVYLDKNSFTDCDYEEVKELLDRRAKIKN